MSIVMSGRAIDERLRRASELADPLDSQTRLWPKIDMSADGVERRLRQASALLALCRELARASSQNLGHRESSSS